MLVRNCIFLFAMAAACLPGCTAAPGRAASNPAAPSVAANASGTAPGETSSQPPVLEPGTVYRESIDAGADVLPDESGMIWRDFQVRLERGDVAVIEAHVMTPGRTLSMNLGSDGGTLESDRQGNLLSVLPGRWDGLHTITLGAAAPKHGEPLKFSVRLARVSAGDAVTSDALPDLVGSPFAIRLNQAYAGRFGAESPGDNGGTQRDFSIQLSKGDLIAIEARSKRLDMALALYRDDVVPVETSGRVQRLPTGQEVDVAYGDAMLLHEVEQTGRYILRVTGALPDGTAPVPGSMDGEFTLRAFRVFRDASVAPDVHVLPVQAPAPRIGFGDYHGWLQRGDAPSGRGGIQQDFRVELKAGQRVTIDVVSRELIPVFTLFQPDGTEAQSSSASEGHVEGEDPPTDEDLAPALERGLGISRSWITFKPAVSGLHALRIESADRSEIGPSECDCCEPIDRPVAEGAYQLRISRGGQQSDAPTGATPLPPRGESPFIASTGMYEGLMRDSDTPWVDWYQGGFSQAFRVALKAGDMVLVEPDSDEMSSTAVLQDLRSNTIGTSDNHQRWLANVQADGTYIVRVRGRFNEDEEASTGRASYALRLSRVLQEALLDPRAIPVPTPASLPLIQPGVAYAGMLRHPAVTDVPGFAFYDVRVKLEAGDIVVMDVESRRRIQLDLHGPSHEWIDSHDEMLGPFRVARVKAGGEYVIRLTSTNVDRDEAVDYQLRVLRLPGERESLASIDRP